MEWQHGYNTDSGYTFGYYAETMPLRLHWAALMQGQNTPIERFRYLDAGCGQGFNLILAAAAHPDSEFVGIDFMPSHIAHARALAGQCGLGNVKFIEADFVELGADSQLAQSLGDFDYVVCHGISAWISPSVKQSLFSYVGRALKPGALFYNSYNSLPGWINVIPFQHLVALEEQLGRDPDPVRRAQSIMDCVLRNSPFGQHFPTLNERLSSIMELDPVYLAQEFNNLHWTPMFVSQMIKDMATVKLDYLGTATLSEIFLDVLPAEISSLIEQEADQRLKIQIKDYALFKSFRRDIYIKGISKVWRESLKNMILDCRFISDPTLDRPSREKGYTFKSGLVEVAGNYNLCSAVMEKMSRQNGLSLREFQSVEKEATFSSLTKTISLMVQSGWVMPFMKGAHSSVVNLGICDAVSVGAPYQCLSAPRIGSAIRLRELDMLFAAARLRGVPAEKWPVFVTERLEALGGALIKAGQRVSDPQMHIDLIVKETQNFKSLIPWLITIGALPA